MTYAIHNTEPEDMGTDLVELEYVEIEEPLCSSILDAYDPERDGAGARVTRTDYALAEAITTLQSKVERQGYEIQSLKEELEAVKEQFADLVKKTLELPY